MSQLQNNNQYLEHIYKVFDISNVPKYRDYKTPSKKKLIKKQSYSSKEETPKEEITLEEVVRPNIDEENYKKSGTLFDYAWFEPSSQWPKVNNIVQMPNVYKLDKKNPNLYDNLFNVAKRIEKEITLDGDTRVKNMQKVSQKPFFSTKPKKVIGALSTAGDMVIPFSPALGFGLKVPGYVQDALELITQPNWSNAIELGLNVVDILPKSVKMSTEKLWHIPYSEKFTNGIGRSIVVQVPTPQGIILQTPSLINNAVQAVNGESLIEQIENGNNKQK